MREDLVKIKSALDTEEYSFLHTEADLYKNILLLRVCGSYGYGTNNYNSDYDVRGICGSRTQDILGLDTEFEQFEDRHTDTVIYTVNKAVSKLAVCNPNIMELLDSRIDDVLYMNDEGKLLLENRQMFLSKIAFHTFGKHAQGMMNKIESSLNGNFQTEEARLKSLSRSIESKITNFNSKYSRNLSISTETVNDELAFHINLTGAKPRKLSGILNELTVLVSNYNKLKSLSNNTKQEGLSKRFMHVIRVLYMCIDILKDQEINMYRENERDILLDIRNSDILDSSGQIRVDLIELKDDLLKEMQKAYDNTTLPDLPNMEEINKLLMDINLNTLKKRGIVNG